MSRSLTGRRLAAVLLLGAGALAGLGYPAVDVLRAHGELAAFQGAPACAAVPAGDCVGQVGATVVGTRTDRSRQPDLLELTVAGRAADVEFPAGDAFLGRLRSRDAVVLGEWRGRIVTVTDEAGFAGRTRRHPAVAFRETWTGDLLLVGIAVVCAGTLAFVARRRPAAG